MGRRIRASRPSPAIVIAVVALVAALAGTALAGPDATTSAINKKKVKKIARKQINKLAPGLSVANAETAGVANHATTANTANSATRAQNASTANGVKPIKVNFAAPSGTPATAFVNQGGVRIRGECTVAGEARLELTNTGAGGALVQFAEVNADGTTAAAPNLAMGSGTMQSVSTGAAPNNVRTVTVTYRAAGGTELSGDVVIARGAGAAQCVIAGTLFVG
jgi:hypothetical protein